MSQPERDEYVQHFIAPTDVPDEISTEEQWFEFHAHLMFTLSLWQDVKNDAGQLARQIPREIDNLWVFLEHGGIRMPRRPCGPWPRHANSLEYTNL
jgi:hypothetical protein